MGRPDPFASLRRFALRSGAPFTIAFIGVTALSFLIVWLGSGSQQTLEGTLRFAFAPGLVATSPWTVATYPLVNVDVLGTLCVCVGLYFFAMPLESRWGTQRFAALFGVFVLACALSFWLGWAVTKGAVVLITAGMPLACCLICWATINPEAKILLYGVLPLKAKWVGWLTTAGVVLGYGYGAPALGLFAGLPLLLAWAYAGGRIKLPTPSARPKKVARESDYRGHDYDKRMQTELERRKLKELFERSFKEGEGDDESKTQ